MTTFQKKNRLALFVILTIPIILFLINIPVAKTLWRHGFDDGSYSHAFLIPFIYAYLCFILYQENKLDFRKKINPLIAFIFILSCYLFFVTTTAQISLAYWASHNLLIITGTMMVYKFHWRIVFPATYLIFMYPLWGPLVEILQTISVIAVSFILRYSDIPIYVENQFITIPAGTFEVADGCSGLRYLITALAIGSLYIFLYLNKIKQILLFLSVAILGALITNWIRIIIIILVGHYTNMTSSLIEDHNMFGWFIFIPFIYFLFKFGDTMESHEKINTDETEYQMIPLPALLLTLTGILFSSTVLHSLFMATSVKTDHISHKKSEIFPIIPYYEQLTTEIKQDNGTTFSNYIYQFNAKDLDSKPTFFNNKMINDHWQLTAETFESNWNFKFFKKNNQFAMIAISYMINGQREMSKQKFKILRLKNALTGNSNTQLNWMGTVCNTNCITEKKQLLQTITKL